MTMAKIKLVFAAVCLAVILIVIFQNVDPVEIQFLFAEVVMPLAVLLAVTFGLGAVLGMFTSGWWWRRR